MIRTVCVLIAVIASVQAGAQVTPPSGTSSPASAATPAAASATPFPKSDAVLPTGTGENRWGPFEGRVVDAETGEDIAGAAVIVFWVKPFPSLAGGGDEFYDARWAVSHTDGRFTVPRRDPPFITWGLSGAYLSCVAPGYLPYEFKPTDIPKHSGFSPLIKARLREGPIVVRMRRVPALTHKQKLGRLEEFFAGNLMFLPDEKLVELERTINTKRAVMGLPAIRAHSGELK